MLYPFKPAIRTAHVLLLVPFLVMGCGLVPSREQFTQHKISISNQTEQDLWIAYHVQNEFLDMSGNGPVAQVSFADTAMVLKARSEHALYTVQFPEFQRQALDMTERHERIISLDFYRIEGDQKIRFEVDQLSDNRWYHEDSDPLSPASSIYHYYYMSIYPEDSD